MEQNILAILELKLKEFNEKNNNLLEDIKKLTNEKAETEKSISDLQIKKGDLTKNINQKTKIAEDLNKMINEIQEGYQNLIESGECLMNIIKQNDS